MYTCALGGSRLRRSGARVDSSCFEMTLNWGLFKRRSNSLSTKGCGESKQTVSFELFFFVVTVRQGKENLPNRQGSARGVFTNCYCRIGCISEGRLGAWEVAHGPARHVYERTKVPLQMAHGTNPVCSGKGLN